jgi:YD repeat-containing protein
MRSPHAYRVALLGVALLLLAAIPFTPSRVVAQTAAAVRYVYDDANRLTAVVDQDGNVAQYVYDAVGNLLRLDRVDAPASAVAITLVSPNRGRVGRAVEIFGKGFADTSGGNTVRFNGVQATVSEASPNRLLTAVPVGATTGSVTVQVTAGTATSPTPFVVGGTIAVTPATSTIWVNGVVQFQATEDATPTSSVTWSVNGITGGDAIIGTIASGGLYTAPTKLGATTTVTITATHSEDRLSSASGTVTVMPGTTPIGAPSVSIAFAAPKTDTESTAVSIAFGEPLTAAKTADVSLVVAESLQALSGALDVAASLEPVITAVSPTSGARGAASFTITLTGAGLSGATSMVFLARSGSTFVADSGITATDLSAAPDGTQLTATVTVATGALLGAHVVQVSAGGGVSTSLGTNENDFTVTAP